MWMPVADNPDSEQLVEDGVEYVVPRHPALEVVSVSVQEFNKCEYLAILVVVLMVAE